MKKLVFAMMLSAQFAFAAAVPGEKAPAFETKDVNGKTVKLSDYSGKWVVLEWFNKDCPYVKKHYGSNNMQKLQQTYKDKGVVWLTVISSAKGKQGYLEPKQALAEMASHKMAASNLLLDVDGTVGKAYDAKTTPHMYVIDPGGKLVYAGAIDDNDSSNPKVIPTSKNFVQAALDSGLAGKKIEMASHTPYGCSVKY